MTKEEVLQKVNEFCNEKSYTNATLTDGFKDKFAEHFVKRYPDANLEDENIIGDMKFAINTAFSGASFGITSKVNEFKSKESDYKTQIEELTKKISNQEPPKFELPKDVQDKLDRLEAFEQKEIKKNKFNEVLNVAKKEIREDYQESFSKFVSSFDVSLDGNVNEQASKWVEKFQDVMKPSIGNIKPLAPDTTQKRDEDFLSSLPKFEI